MDTLTDQLNAIAAGTFAGVTDNDKRFANDLLNGQWGLRSRGYLTERQMAAAQRMFQRLTAPKPPADAAPPMTGVYDFLMAARKHLKYPKILLAMGKRHLKVYLSGSRSRQPDVVNLVTEDDYGQMDFWLGRVYKDGQWQHREIPADLQTQVSSLLTRLAENPAKVAAEHGHLTGNCCFCNRPLDDPRSTTVGYGPVCAKHFSLPWG